MNVQKKNEKKNKNTQKQSLKIILRSYIWKETIVGSTPTAVVYRMGEVRMIGVDRLRVIEMNPLV